MIPKTPRGFRDCLPYEAAWRSSVTRSVRDTFASWGYLPIETPAVELLEVLETPGSLDDTPFRFFDSDNNLLVMRPDSTLPVARLVATRLHDQQGPFRFHYAQRAFCERESTYGQDREFKQLGIEFIGGSGFVADAEVVCLLFEALAAAGVSDFTVAIGTVEVLNALVERASSNEGWKSAVYAAFHDSDFVAIDALAADERAVPLYAQAISQLAHIRGGAEAFDECRALVAPLGCERGLAELQRCFELATANTQAGTLMVDFSIVSSFDYYTGMVFKAYAPGVAASLASGGRYDTTLAAFGRPMPAAGFAIGLERTMAALEAAGVTPPQVGPDAVVECDDPYAMFVQAAKLRGEGKRVAMGGGARA